MVVNWSSDTFLMFSKGWLPGAYLGLFSLRIEFAVYVSSRSLLSACSHMHTYIQLFMHMHTFTYAHVCSHTHMKTHICTHSDKLLHAHICIQAYSHMQYTQTHPRRSYSACILMHTYADSHIQHSHTLMHTCTYFFLPGSSRSWLSVRDLSTQ